MRSLGCTLLALLTAVAFAGWGAPPRRLHAHAPDASSVVQAYTAAWNTHDLPSVLALLAPDAVVRQRRRDVPAAVWDTRDPQVVRAYQEEISFTADPDPEAAVLVLIGQPQIAAWAAARFGEGHRMAAGPYYADGDTVRWAYREFVEPFAVLPGGGPLEGEAEALVRDGRIAVLSLVLSAASVQRRLDELDAAARAATRRALPAGAPPDARARGPRRTAEPAGAAWPLTLGSLAILASAAVVPRRRRS